ncbi:hypothetical protein ZYGR_0U01500 [Zygosaccharomyces rouxii]|uniref:ZYRO0F12056p n=2 Tax=Zygosaccharomyces rouxii TaxID=4956 RepID=C5DYD0_ZYGRC|nr:uncharacterized protein ZYRO0F12056g [Zygosaccharomyces rouxii]KAH9199550.1 hypothetical protein LQ764DRAFT_131719 [Zygosaccharomyces rouxii]GAV50294.1 hypothetical protein ZYGR_0U01500 [Zygosaccharomyces rouxii]CAR28791.1 ZYRO0F12056p [Zygosaccharomyces rouxii]
MPRKSLCHTLDVSKDFVRPRSLTLTWEELQDIPSPKRQSATHLEKLIKINLKDMGIVRGLTKIRRALGGEELGQRMVKNENEEHIRSKYKKPSSLKPPLIVSHTQTPNLPHSEGKHMLNGSGFSPQASMNTVPSPSMHASLSTPEYTNSEVESSGDAFSEISSLAESLAVSPRIQGSISPRQLKRTVIQPHIFEFSDYDEDDDDGGDDEGSYEELLEKIKMVRLPPIDH